MKQIRTLDVNIVTDVVIDKMNDYSGKSLLSNLKLQKILYYLQAWCLGIHGKELFNGSIQAWIHGPVCVEVYNRFRDTKWLYSEMLKSDILNPEPIQHLNKDEDEFINFVLENYGRFSGAELEAMTHNESPWIEAREGYGPNDRCDVQISNDKMKLYYAEKWNAIRRQGANSH